MRTVINADDTRTVSGTGCRKAQGHLDRPWEVDWRRLRRLLTSWSSRNSIRRRFRRKPLFIFCSSHPGGFLRCPRGNGSGPSLGGVPGCGRRSLRRSSASRLNRSPAGSLRAARPGVGGPCRSDRECNRYALRQAKAAARQVRPTDQPGFWRAAGPSIPPSGGGHPRNPDAKASLVQTLFSGDNTVCSFPRRRPRRSCSMRIRAGSA